MPARYRVALHGFSEFERKTLTFCFEHAAMREPGYVQVDLIAESDFIVADASHGAIAGSAIRGERMRDTLFVGDKPPLGASAYLQRPIDPERILRALDQMAAQLESRARDARPDVVLPLNAPDAIIPLLDLKDMVDTTPAVFKPEPVSITFNHLESLDTEDKAPSPLQATDAAPPAAQDWRAASPAIDAELPAVPGDATPAEGAARTKLPKPARLSEAERAAAKDAARRASRRARLAQAAAGAAAADAPRDVLLLNPMAGPVALGFVLESFGFVVHRADSIAAAKAVLEHTPLAAAFLDVAAQDSTAPDGLDLCHRIKHRLLALAGAVPAVMLMSAHDSAAERVRGKLAGCDAFLIRPVRRGDAARALESCNVALPADARRA